MLLSAILAVSRCGEVLTLVSGAGRKTQVPYWPVFLLRLQITSVYAWTAIAKINEQYLSGEVLDTFMHDWVPVSGPLLGLVAAASVLTEMFLALALWSRRLLLPATLLGAGLHIGSSCC